MTSDGLYQLISVSFENIFYLKQLSTTYAQKLPKPQRKAEWNYLLILEWKEKGQVNLEKGTILYFC
jgi:hypothetical protein